MLLKYIQYINLKTKHENTYDKSMGKFQFRGIRK